MDLVQPIAHGKTAKVYLHEGKLVKLYEDYLPKGIAKYEADKQKYAYDCGLPVPVVHKVSDFNGTPSIVMEYISGQTIGELIVSDVANAKKYLELSVDIQLKIHATPAIKIEMMRDKLERQILSVDLLSDRIKADLLEKLSLVKYENHLCHGDFHIHNLIYTEERTYVIDWVDASAGDVKADVCRTYLIYLQISEEIAEIYLHIYCEKSGVSRDEVFVWMPIIAAARLSENLSDEKAKLLINIINEYN